MTPHDAMTRRRFIQIAGASGLASVMYLHGGCRGGAGSRRRSAANGKRMIVVGVDGMDPRLAERMMDAGELPHFAKLRRAGGYSRLGTSIPPQSPVAWANFITGAGPGEHGIFDFIHRDPADQCRPYYSASETIQATDGWEVGEHRLPLSFWPFNHSTTHTLLKREGTPFWDYLDEAGIPSWFYDIPSDYPPSPSAHGNHRCLAGMGTPDLLGTYGTYQFYSSRRRTQRERGGGKHKPLVFRDNVATATLTGPLNTLLKKPEDTEIPFTVYRDPDHRAARIELQGHTLVLREGEWSGWLRVRFPLRMPTFLPDDEVGGICRLYLQSVSPDFRLYCSPLNIDPAEPAQDISQPPDFVRQISSELGLFYTTGFQEDHKALSNRVFDDEEYRRQADYVLEERMNLLNYALEHYDDGLLFFYFSSTDLQAHMFWWDSDEPHPVRSADDARKYMGAIQDVYRRMDTVVGDLRRRYPDATLVLLSDHGFCNFRRQFNLNTWLRENGYLSPDDCDSILFSRTGRSVRWQHTRAYGLGLNGLYLNLRGRERDGIVNPADRDALLEEIRGKLLAVRDPENGQPAIASVYRSDQVYDGPYVGRAPDLIIGYHRGYRSSWGTTLGDIGEQVFTDNDSAWSADHCMATEALPGVLFASRPIVHASPALSDLAPTILRSFGVKVPPQMQGKPVLEV
jgi:predicted AlkP superfamily phosphohydrolase/phosphomutase